MANRQPNMIPIDNLNLGGLSDSKWSGVKYSVYKMIGLNPHQIPGILRVSQKLTKETLGQTVSEFCMNSVVSTNGRTFWFSSESGKIWMRDLDGTWSLVYIVAPSTGQAKILGAYEYQEYIYVATEQKLHKIAANVAIDAAGWTANIILNWATFKNFDLDFHPMLEQNLVLYIGDGSDLAQVDSGTFSPSALDVKSPLRIKSLGRVGTDVLIGTFIADNVTKTELFRWNTFSGSFQVSNQIDEVGVNAFLSTDNFIFVQAGLGGRIYVYDYVNNRLELFKTVPGEYGPTQFNTCNPDAVATLNGIALFGISNGMGNPSDEGVFAIGRHSRNYPYIMDMPYPISERSGSEFALSNIEIGSILVSGFDLFVSWRRTEGLTVTYGVDKLDYTAKLNGAYIESRVLANNRDEFASFGNIIIAYASLPDLCDIQIFSSKNYQPYVQSIKKLDTMKNIIFADNDSTEATTLQVRFKMITNSNTGPELESGGVKLR